MKKEYYIYIVHCSDKSFYTGITNNLERRIIDHNQGQDKYVYTYSRRPVKLVYFETYFDVNQAISREKQIKRWAREKKKALIKRQSEKLIKLARGKKGYLKNNQVTLRLGSG